MASRDANEGGGAVCSAENEQQESRPEPRALGATSANPTHQHLRQQKFGAGPDCIEAMMLIFALHSPSLCAIRAPTRLAAAHGFKSFYYNYLPDNRFV